MKVTLPTLLVLRALVEQKQTYGFEIIRKADLQSGTVYPILQRLQDEGWVRGSWERPKAKGRPARRFYTLTALGRREALAMLARTTNRLEAL